MKNKLLLIFSIITVAFIVSFNINISFGSTATEMDITLANVEALALAECTGGSSPCSPTCSLEYCGYCSEGGGYMLQCYF
jgi:hypothetical protein